MNTTTRLISRSFSVAKCELENAVRDLKHSLGPSSPLSYFWSTVANVKTFDRRIADVELSLNQVRLVERIHALYVECGEFRAKELAEKNVRIAAREDKKNLKTRLNLQKGVPLPSSLPAYEKIVECLEPVRLHYYGLYLEALKTEVESYIAKVKEAGTFELAFPLPGNVRDPNNIQYGLSHSVIEATWKRRERAARFYHHNGFVYNVIRPDLNEWMDQEATRDALYTIQGYASKMADKMIAKVPSAVIADAKVSTSDFWRWSIMTITLVDGSVHAFRTQMIWNRSVLGKVFNQWPTTVVE